MIISTLTLQYIKHLPLSIDSSLALLYNSSLAQLSYIALTINSLKYHFTIISYFIAYNNLKSSLITRVMMAKNHNYHHML